MTTPPFSKFHNELADRTNGTTVECARTMLVPARLPTQFWAEAVFHASHVRNVLPRNFQLPLTILWQEKNLICHFFVCLGPYHTIKYRRSDDPRCKRDQMREWYSVYIKLISSRLGLHKQLCKLWLEELLSWKNTSLFTMRYVAVTIIAYIYIINQCICINLFSRYHHSVLIL